MSQKQPTCLGLDESLLWNIDMCSEKVVDSAIRVPKRDHQRSLWRPRHETCVQLCRCAAELPVAWSHKVQWNRYNVHVPVIPDTAAQSRCSSYPRLLDLLLHDMSWSPFGCAHLRRRVQEMIQEVSHRGETGWNMVKAWTMLKCHPNSLDRTKFNVISQNLILEELFFHNTSPSAKGFRRSLAPHRWQPSVPCWAPRTA